jgi:flagellar hook assembly protein FlgD
MTLVGAKQAAGKYAVTWNGRDSYGKEVASGVYYYQVRAEGFSMTKKMMLLH